MPIWLINELSFAIVTCSSFRWSRLLFPSFSWKTLVLFLPHRSLREYDRHEYMISFSATDHVIRVIPRVLTRLLVVLGLEGEVSLGDDISASLLEEGSGLNTCEICRVLTSQGHSRFFRPGRVL